MIKKIESQSSKIKMFGFACLCLMGFNSGANETEVEPLNFIENKGQWDANINYTATVGSGSVYLENNTFTFVQMNPEDLEEQHHLQHENPAISDDYPIHCHAWKTSFVGAQLNNSIQGIDKNTAYYNYYIGNDESKWATNVPSYSMVTYDNIYDGINMNVYSQAGNFKYDLIVSPNVSTSIIKMNYDGLDAIKLEEGNLVLKTTVGEFIEVKPYAYQIINGMEVQVACNYQLNNNEVSFEFPEGYDDNIELIIDPILVAATLSSSTVTNYGHSATFDNDGNIYTGARNFGAGYPATVGAFQTTFGGGGVDIAISKISDDGTTLIYASYLGGSDSEFPHSMIVNGNGELFVLGTSSSADFPTTAGAFDTTIGGSGDLIVTHFSDDGASLIASTYVGGGNTDGSNSLSTNYGDDFRGEIILDPGGNCLISSCTNSTDFPTTPGAYQENYGSGTQDGVVFSMPANLSSMIWSTYVGGAGHEVCFGIRMDDAGDVYVSGATDNEFITATGYQTNFQGGAADGFVIKLGNAGSTLDESSYWGTADADYAFFLDIGVDDGVYLYGQSQGGNSPVTAGVYSNAGSAQFICKLDPTLTNLAMGTVVGSGSGTTDFSPIAFMVDNCNYIYFSGHSGIGGVTTLPTSAGALQTTGGFYLGVLDPGAVTLNYATHYGGASDHVDGGTSRFDPAGIVYQAVCTNNGFNTTAGAVASTYPGGFNYDIGVFKIDFQVNALYAQAAASPSLNGCAPFDVDFTNTSSGGTYTWDFGDGSPTETTFEPSHTFINPGVYNVMLVAFDAASCNTYDTSYVTVTVGSGTTPTADFTYDVNCATQSVTCTSTGTAGVPLVWDMGDGTTYSGTPISHTYAALGTYTITLTAGDGICAGLAVASYDVSVSAAPVTPIFNDPTCFGFSDGSITLNVAGGSGSETFLIEDVAGTSLNVGGSNAANNLAAGWYYYNVDLGGGCSTADSVELMNPGELQVGMTIIDPLCNGLATGIAMIDTVLNWQNDYNNISFFWNPNPSGVGGQWADSAYAMPAGDYVLTINDDNGCSNIVDFTIEEPPLLEFTEIGTDPAYCRMFYYQSGMGVVYAAASGGTPDYTYLWTNLETGVTSNNTTWGGLNPADYTIVVTDDNGCTLTQTLTLDSLNPLASFDMASLGFDIEWEGTSPIDVNFTNLSQYYANPNNPNADTTFFWNFDYDNSSWWISHDINDTYDTTYTGGTYTICLTALNKNGCSDTLCQEIIVYEPFNFDPVNVFTPNGNGVNDVFTFENFAVSVKTFECLIVDRWGVEIIAFDDITDSWNGTDKNGDMCPDGTYFYIYSGTSENVDSNGANIPFDGQGAITLINQE